MSELSKSQDNYERLVLLGTWHIISLLLMFYAQFEKKGILVEIVTESAKNANGKIGVYLNNYPDYKRDSNEMNFPKDGRGIEYCDPSGGFKE